MKSQEDRDQSHGIILDNVWKRNMIIDKHEKADVILLHASAHRKMNIIQIMHEFPLQEIDSGRKRKKKPEL